MLSIFKAGDSTMNLHTPPGIYRVHIKEVQGMPCKYEVIKISDTNFFFLCFRDCTIHIFIWRLRVLVLYVWAEWDQWYVTLAYNDAVSVRSNLLFTNRPS